MAKDVLAAGGSRAQFRTAGSQVTAERWAAIWAEDKPVEPVVPAIEETKPTGPDAPAETSADRPRKG